MGPIGSGKSVGCVMECFTRALEQEPNQEKIRKTRMAVIRNTYRELEDTTVKTWLEWIPEYLGNFNWQSMTHHIKFRDVECEVLFRALDRPQDVKKLLSLELTMAWVNEAREIPHTVIKMLRGRVGRYPSQKEGGPTWYGVIMDTNPPDEDSWWYEMFEEDRPENHAIFKQPGGLTKKAENIKNLPRGYYENLYSKDLEWNKVYIDGQYGVVEDGKPVYPEYNDNIHCKPCTPIKKKPIHRGWDFGLTPSCVFSQVLPSGKWIVFDEMVSEHMGADRFSDDVVLHSNEKYQGWEFVDTGDPAGNTPSESDEKTCFQILRKKNIDIQPGEQTPAIRIESVKKPLNTMIGGEPGFQLDPKCKKLRKGFQGRYKYRRIMVAEEKYADKPEKNEYSHPHDGLQYTATKIFAKSLTKKRNKDFLKPLKINTRHIV